MNSFHSVSREDADPSPGRRVLVIDDHASILALLKIGLGLQGYAVETACGAFAGLEQFRTRHPDVVLLDRGMADLDGPAVAAEIKRMDPHMPVVMLTGTPHLMMQPEDDCGAIDAVVSKPFSSTSLQEGILTALHRQAA